LTCDIVRLVGVGAALGLVLASGCAGGGDARSGLIEVEWTDSAGRGAVRFAVPATARWCAADSMLEIVGSRHDTAIGVVLLARDSAISGLGSDTLYPAAPARAFIPWRPRALAGLVLAEAMSVRTYESGLGEVRLGARAAPFSGTFDLRLAAANGPDSLRVTGRFRGLRVVPAPPNCVRVDKPPTG